MRITGKKRQDGFTLTELLVAISVTSLLFVGIMTFLVTTLADNSVRQARADLLRETQLTLDSLTKDIRLSANVDDKNTVADSNSPDAATKFGRGWESNANTLILSKSVEDNDKNIVFQDAAHYVTEKNNIVYFLNDRVLYKRTIAANVANNRNTTSCPKTSSSATCPADVELVHNVESFNLRYFDGMNDEVNPDEARSVETTLVLLKEKYGKQIKATYTTRTVFRNE